MGDEILPQVVDYLLARREGGQDIDEPEESEADLELTTLSGIALGDTVDDLISTYTQYTISFEVINSKDHFRLSDGGELLQSLQRCDHRRRQRQSAGG